MVIVLKTCSKYKAVSILKHISQTGHLMCLMIESMGDRRWLEVEARERVELDLEKVY